jgi:hypothetical protein
MVATVATSQNGEKKILLSMLIIFDLFCMNAMYFIELETKESPSPPLKSRKILHFMSGNSYKNMCMGLVYKAFLIKDMYLL